VQPKKKRKLNSGAPVVILDDSESDEDKTTEMDTQDDDIPITKLIEKGEKMVNKLETIKKNLNEVEVQRPKIVLKDVNDNKDFFGARRKPLVPEESSSSSSSENEEDEEPVMPSVVKVKSITKFIIILITFLVCIRLSR
jgi:hypothetical protein